MVTVASFSTPFEAHVARAKLESEGIPAFVLNEHTINMYWLYSLALGGVMLQVPSDCVQRAAEILQEDVSEELVAEQGGETDHCPKCGGDNIEAYTRGKKPSFIVFLFLSFPLWPFKRKTKCLDCGEVSDYQPLDD